MKPLEGQVAGTGKGSVADANAARVAIRYFGAGVCSSRPTPANASASRSSRVTRHGFASSYGTAWLMAACIPGAAEGPGMVMRVASILVVVLGLSTQATAREHSGVLHRMSCTVVRYYVARYTASAAEQYARNMGATDADIEVARRCIKA
jgi:hypothetical protein